MGSPIKEPLAFYTNQILHHKAASKKLKMQLLRSSLLRLGVFILVCVLVYFFNKNVKLLALLVGLGIVLFLYLVSRHQDLKYKRAVLKKRIEINEKEIEILHRNFQDNDTGELYKDPSHAYSHDIDLFGVGSFFQYVNRTSLQSGTDYFAAILTENSTHTISEKQEAIKELATLASWRQHFAAIASLVSTKTKTKTVLAWLQNYTGFAPSYSVVISTVFSICSGIAITTYFLGFISGYLLFGWFLIGLILSGLFLKKVNELSMRTSQIQTTFEQYYKLIKSIENQNFSAGLLQHKKSQIVQDTETASSVLKQFSRYLNSLDQRNNLLIGVITNGFMLRDIRVSYHIEAWITRYKSNVAQWFECIHFYDAYNSLGGFAFNHPSYVYPIITTKQPTLAIKNGAHPLLDPSLAVANSLHIDSGQFFIITGANMAGKSTFLRTVGLQIVMANIGLPTCAEQVTYRPIKLITSMRTTDSLTDDASYFFSELQRLKFIVNAIKEDAYFIILDEILKGTNSEDKAKGSKKFIEKLVQSNATGIIATHDLSLCETADSFPQIENYYFDATIANDELHFDYTFKKGVCQNMNASFLLKKMGIVD